MLILNLQQNNTLSRRTAAMPISLLTLPYELREQVLTTLLSHKSNIRLQEPIESRSLFTAPIVQVCKPLREEAIRVFYQVNAFTWVIDPEAVSPDEVILPGNDRLVHRGGCFVDPDLILRGDRLDFPTRRNAL